MSNIIDEVECPFCDGPIKTKGEECCYECLERYSETMVRAALYPEDVRFLRVGLASGGFVTFSRISMSRDWVYLNGIDLARSHPSNMGLPLNGERIELRLSQIAWAAELNS